MNSQQIRAIRAFNRFYTNIIGLVNHHILDSDYSLPEARILFELYHSPGLTASDIIMMLDVDKGYLSRILRRFEERGLVARAVLSADKRVIALRLTVKGGKEFEILNRASDRQVEQAFRNLGEKDCRELLGKMREIEQLITKNKVLS